MQERKAREIVSPLAVSDGAGVRLRRSIATPTLDHLDPFFLFDHFGSENPDDYVAGFPMHPHRGIETVTYMLDGSVAHRDSLGNSGVIGAGDVQWMTAGSGILHEEMPKVGPRRLDGFQVWVNLPRKLKMTRPRYQDVPAASIPLESPVRITADPATNALIVSASPQDWRTLAGVIGELDVRRRQVFVEAVILEVTAEKMRALGVEFQGATSTGNGNVLVTYPSGTTWRVEVNTPGRVRSCTGTTTCP